MCTCMQIYSTKLSEQPDLNRRPLDVCLLYPLQSSALPTELCSVSNHIDDLVIRYMYITDTL